VSLEKGHADQPGRRFWLWLLDDPAGTSEGGVEAGFDAFQQISGIAELLRWPARPGLAGDRVPGVTNGEGQVDSADVGELGEDLHRYW